MAAKERKRCAISEQETVWVEVTGYGQIVITQGDRSIQIQPHFVADLSLALELARRDAVQ